MNAASRLQTGNDQPTPLSHLFAYIRDLFNTSRPLLHFDKDAQYPQERNQNWWLLADLLQLARDKSEQGHSPVQIQFDFPDKPVLRIKRVDSLALPPIPKGLEGWVEIDRSPGREVNLKIQPKRKISFSANPKRIAALKEFFAQTRVLESHAQKEAEIPEILTDWLEWKETDDAGEWEAKKQAFEHFDDEELRIELAKSYQRKIRTHYHKYEQHARINQLYEGLHSLYYALKAKPERHLSLSFGLLSVGNGKHSYQNFLFHLPLKLELERQELRVEFDPVHAEFSCEHSFLENLPLWFPEESEAQIEQRRHEVLRQVDAFYQSPRRFELDPEHIHRNFYDPALNILGVFPLLQDRFFSNGELNFEWPELPAPGIAQFSFSPVFQTRSRESGIHVSQDAANILSKIQELSQNGRNDEIPQYFKRLFSLNQQQNGLRIAYKRAAAFKTAPEAQISSPLPSRFLFPLPYNEEQLTIAKRLAEQDTVIVKGPPGTGKSHTIANLTSHFVAQGKSILIVSKNAKALEVIKGKLPQEIRYLAISLVKPEEQQQDLKFAIDAIKDRLSREYDPEEIQQKEALLDQWESDQKMLIQQIQAQIQQNNQVLSLTNPLSDQTEHLSAVEWANRFAQIPATSFEITDPVPTGWKLAPIAQEISEWLKQQSDLDFGLLSWEFPDPEGCIEASELAKIQSEINQWQRSTAASLLQPYIQKGILSEGRINDWQALRNQIKNQFPLWASFQPWLEKPGFQLLELLRHFQNKTPIIQEAIQEQEVLLAYQIDLGALKTGDPANLLNALDRLLQKLSSPGAWGFIQRKTLSPGLKAFFQCQINGKAVEDEADLKWIYRYLQQQIRLSELQIFWENVFAIWDVDAPGGNILALCQKIKSLVMLYESLASMNAQLKAVGLPKLSFPPKPEDKSIEILEAVEVFKDFQNWQNRKTAAIKHLQPQSNTHPLVAEIHLALQKGEQHVYSKLLPDYKSLRSTYLASLQAHQDLENLSLRLPRTVQLIREGTIDSSDIQEWQHALFAAQIKSLLTEIQQDLEQLPDLFEKLRSTHKKTEALIAEIIALKTWRHKQESILPEQKSALSAWRNDLINIGKGHGKNTGRNLTSAIANMQKAREVVPIWIMQQDTAIRFFPDPQPGQFDILIIDEASQCDISMLNLIFRARKSIIVGDENQTSVSTNASMFPIERTNQILDRYLHQHPFRQQFHINNRTASIYTLSGVIYPNIISLREHFRCRPEIIGFSNRFMYDQQIIPLKTSSDEFFGKAVEALYVEDEGKNKRKPQIVAKAIELIEGVIEDAQAGFMPNIPSVGILCLESSNDLHKEAMIRAIGRSPLIKAHEDALKLLVGSSREFQGDERDVMILTTTASHSIDKNGRYRSPRSVMGEEMSRIYNVAASRARMKSILLHSIHPEGIAAMAPHCLRRQLIDYYQNQSAFKSDLILNPLEKAEKMLGPIGASLCQKLQESSQVTHIQPGKLIGPYQIDLAFSKDGHKYALAIDKGNSPQELEHKLKQQMILERAGWQFLRIQALNYILSPQTEWARILKWLSLSQE